MECSSCGDVSTIDLIVVTQIMHAILGREFPRKLDYVIAGKCHIPYFYALRGYKSVQYMGFFNNF